MSSLEEAKRRAAEEAAGQVQSGMTVGLGTGSTVAHLLDALARRSLDIRCVATSVATEQQGSRLGLRIEPFRGIERLDIAIDGADQVTPDRWLVKGGGAAHTREKIVAAAAERFVVIVSDDKLVERLRPPVPVELLSFGLESTLARLGQVALRAGTPPSPDGGVIADWTGPVGDPSGLAVRLSTDPGVISHGLFEPELVSDVVVGRAG